LSSSCASTQLGPSGYPHWGTLNHVAFRYPSGHPPVLQLQSLLENRPKVLAKSISCCCNRY